MVTRCLLSGLIALFMGTNVYAADSSNIIAQALKGYAILNVSVASIPHDSGLMITVETNAGPRKFIVAPEELNNVLTTLKNPLLMGMGNAVIVTSIMQQHPATTVASTTPAQPGATGTSAKPLPTPGASAIVASAVTSANQQASK